MYKSVFVAGTFDGLHKGHEALLHIAYKTGERVTIGLTSDVFVRKYKPDPDSVTPYTGRNEALVSWVDAGGYSERTTVIPIDDPYEPLASMPADAIVITSDTKSRAVEINEKRVTNKLSALTLIEVAMELAQDGRPISSTRVKAGEIDAQGHMVMPESLRPVLREPLGKVIENGNIHDILFSLRGKKVITVGDVTSKRLVEAGLVPDLSVIDLNVNRKPMNTLSVFADKPDLHLMCVKSGPGRISKQAISAICGALSGSQKTVLVVDGEEDLLVLPAVEYAPEGSVLFYGQPPVTEKSVGMPLEGLVQVDINAETKTKVAELLKQFT